MKNTKHYMISNGYKIGRYYFEKGIKWTFKKFQNFYTGGEVTANFDMSSVTIKTEQGSEITLENENFEILIAEYIRRKKEIKVVNK